MRKVVIGSLIVLMQVVVAGCGNSHNSPPPVAGDVATFIRVQNEVFLQTCATAGCHDTITRQAALDLSAGQAYVQIVNIASVQIPSLMRIAPNDPGNSYLFQKISSSSPAAGLRMPSGAILADSQINLVRDWILRGAPND
jgi:hypothetical protein